MSNLTNRANQSAIVYIAGFAGILVFILYVLPKIVGVVMAMNRGLQF